MKAARSGILLLWSAASLLHAAVPTPRSYFGHEIGADKTVLDWDKVAGYFHELQKTSDRIRVEELGKSTEGRPFLAATIADPATFRRLDRYIEIQQKLADPRKTPPAEAEKLFAEGKTVVLITCSIHSTEIASTINGRFIRNEYVAMWLASNSATIASSSVNGTGMTVSVPS